MSHDPWALLREARQAFGAIETDADDSYDCDCPPEWARCPACRIKQRARSAQRRIDAALAESRDSATPVVEWRPSDQRVFLDGVSLRVVYQTDGLWVWSVYWPLSHRTEQGRCATEEEAKSAALAASKENK